MKINLFTWLSLVEKNHFSVSLSLFLVFSMLFPFLSVYYVVFFLFLQSITFALLVLLLPPLLRSYLFPINSRCLQTKQEKKKRDRRWSKKKERERAREKKNVDKEENGRTHTYMRISWFDDAWRSKTEQTANRFFCFAWHIHTHCILRGRMYVRNIRQQIDEKRKCSAKRVTWILVAMLLPKKKTRKRWNYFVYFSTIFEKETTYSIKLKKSCRT